MSGGELCLLQHEVDQIEVMRDKMLNNEIINKLITGNVEYEVPGIIEIENNLSKENNSLYYYWKKTSCNSFKFNWFDLLLGNIQKNLLRIYLNNVKKLYILTAKNSYFIHVWIQNKKQPRIITYNELNSKNYKIEDSSNAEWENIKITPLLIN